MENTILLKEIYREVKRINSRLDALEKFVEEVLLRELPKVRVSEEEKIKILNAIKEMKKGEYATIDKLNNV